MKQGYFLGFSRRLRVLLALLLVPVLVVATPNVAGAIPNGDWKSHSGEQDADGGIGTVAVVFQARWWNQDPSGPKIEVGGGICQTPEFYGKCDEGDEWLLSFTGNLVGDAANTCELWVSGTLGPHPDDSWTQNLKELGHETSASWRFTSVCNVTGWCFTSAADGTIEPGEEGDLPGSVLKVCGASTLGTPGAPPISDCPFGDPVSASLWMEDDTGSSFQDIKGAVNFRIRALEGDDPVNPKRVRVVAFAIYGNTLKTPQVLNKSDPWTLYDNNTSTPIDRRGQVLLWHRPTDTQVKDGGIGPVGLMIYVNRADMELALPTVYGNTSAGVSNPWEGNLENSTNKSTGYGLWTLPQENTSNPFLATTEPDHCRFYLGPQLATQGTQATPWLPVEAGETIDPPDAPPPATEAPGKKSPCTFSWTDPTTWPTAGICALVELFAAALDTLKQMWGVLSDMLAAILDLAGQIASAIGGALRDALEWAFVPDPSSWGWQGLVDQVESRPPASVVVGLGQTITAVADGYRSAGGCGTFADFSSEDIEAEITCQQVKSVPGFNALYALMSLTFFALTGLGLFKMFSDLMSEGQ